MNSKRSLYALAATSLLFAVACGGDDDNNNSNGTGGDNGTGGSTGGSGGSTGGSGGATGGSGGSTVTGCPDHPNVTEGSQGECRVSAPISAPMTQDLTIDATNTWLLDGPLVVGDDAAETIITFEPGATLYGGDGSFLLIQRGSKILADGTKEAPIVLTSAQNNGSRGPQDWGGLVINGRAPINNGEADGSAPGEAGTGRYGGSDPADNSGILRYVRVEFAGNMIDQENELNGIAFQGVGSGTTVDYVQTHMNSDDGIEFFGGTVNAKHLVITGADDDSLDWTGGFRGKLQFVIAEQLPASGTAAERGIEADNLDGANSATPYSEPTLSNVTLIARAANPAEGMRLRRGTKGQLWNMVVTGFGGFCAVVSEDQTIANVTDGSLALKNSVLDCIGGAFEAAMAAEQLVNATGANNQVASPMLTDWIPQAGSPALTAGGGPTDEFFDSVTYAGAFDGTANWTDGWIETAEN